VLLVASSLPATEPGFLLPGQYHGDEVSAVSGQDWLALIRPAAGPDVLEPVALQVDTVLDEILDEDGAPSGKRVTVADGRDPVLFLLKDVPGVRPRPIRTIATDVALQPDQPVSLALDATAPYTVGLECAAPESSTGYEQAPCMLVVRSPAGSQVLRTYDAYYQDGSFGGLGNDASARIVWAGDLNGDARLDLVVDLTDHYNVSLPTLFISAERGDEPLLLRVAEHRSVGC